LQPRQAIYRPSPVTANSRKPSGLRFM
jgi:hypothetical protein